MFVYVSTINKNTNQRQFDIKPKRISVKQLIDHLKSDFKL